MYVESVTLKNFRNYREKTVLFKDGLNIVVGKNASGKTNLLESVYVAGIGRSPRTNKYKDMIRWGNDCAYIKVSIKKKYSTHTIEYSIDSQDKKRIAIDGIPLVKLSEILGMLNIVFFSPDEMKLVKESPVERRRFMDISLSQQNKNYFNALSKYNAIISQRNKLLKEEHNPDKVKEMLYGWDSQLASYGAVIISKRYEFIDKIKVFADKNHSEISSDRERLQLEYECEISKDDIDTVRKNFLEKLNLNFEKDLSLQYTSFGCHRDDIAIKINGVDARKFASQGQQRTAALSLKLAEIGFFESETGEKPVLLLDDVLSELDSKRRQKLMEISSSLQTIITCTDFDGSVNHNLIKISSDTSQTE